RVEGRLVVGLAARLPHWLFVPVHAEALQLSEDDVIGPRHDPRCVDVFDAYEPAAMVSTGVKVAGHGRDQRTSVKRAAGAGGESPRVYLRHGRRSGVMMW